MAKTDNRTNGNRFEQEFANILAANKFWVHVMQQNKSGQPADIIAIKGRYHTLIDCKVISTDQGFQFDRVEENQKYAMRLFQKRCGELCYFALKLPSGAIRLINLERIETLRNRGRKRLTEKDMEEQTWSLEKWLEASTMWAEDV